MQFMAYMHPYIGRGRATLAIAHDLANGQTYVGVSYSSPKDNFNRKKGRNIATQRILKKSLYSFDFVKRKEEFLKEAALSHFLDFNAVSGPSWAQKRAPLRGRVRLDRYFDGYEDSDACPNCVTPWKCNGPHQPLPPF